MKIKHLGVYFNDALNKIGLALDGEAVVYYERLCFYRSRKGPYLNSLPIVAYSARKGWLRLGDY